MKQHITLEELREVDSSLIAEKLVKTGFVKVEDNEWIKSDKAAKQLNIGKMIEILRSKSHSIMIETDSDLGVEWWNVVDYDTGKFLQSKELCDALWEAVKYVLTN